MPEKEVQFGTSLPAQRREKRKLATGTESTGQTDEQPPAGKLKPTR
jgi:hypothetical protein